MNKREAKRIALNAIISLVDVHVGGDNDLTCGWPDSEADREKVHKATEALLDEWRRKAERMDGAQSRARAGAGGGAGRR